MPGLIQRWLHEAEKTRPRSDRHRATAAEIRRWAARWAPLLRAAALLAAILLGAYGLNEMRDQAYHRHQAMPIAVALLLVWYALTGSSPRRRR